MADLINLKPVAPVALNLNFYGSELCTRHPFRRQCPGVCSVCVNEKLARLSTSNSSSLAPGSSSLSDVSSECSSPGRVQVKLANRGSLSFVKRSEKDEIVLSKSRSMAAAVARRVRGGGGGGGGKEMRSGGFWSKVVKRAKKKKIEH